MQAAQGRSDQTGDQALAAENGPQRLAKRNIAIVARRQTAFAIQFPVRDSRRQDRPTGGQRRLQQRGVKMQQAAAISRRAFGKERDHPALSQMPGNFFVDDPGVPATAATQEDGVASRRQPAKQRPASDLFLGDEDRRDRRIDDENVNPGNVIGDQQHPCCRVGQVGLEFDPQRIKRGDRPALFEQDPAPFAAERKQAQRDNCPADDQQGQTKKSEGALR